MLLPQDLKFSGEKCAKRVILFKKKLTIMCKNCTLVRYNMQKCVKTQKNPVCSDVCSVFTRRKHVYELWRLPRHLLHDQDGEQLPILTTIGHSLALPLYWLMPYRKQTFL